MRALHGTQEDYLRALHERFAGLDLTGLDVALDCAHGATYRGGARDLPPPRRDRHRAQRRPRRAQHQRRLRLDARRGAGARRSSTAATPSGFALDGDGDRVLAVDRNGAVVDGDELIALAALHLRGAGRLPGDGVAVTVMTNYGFHVAMREAGVEVATTQVGDRYVLEALRERGWTLGGEQSGHIIDMGFNATGDGIASALLTLEALQGADLADRHAMEKLPQRLVNVRVDDRDAAMASSELAEASAREARALEGRGRVLVRPSGTEQLVRVMVEAPSDDEAVAACDRLVAIVARRRPRLRADGCSSGTSASQPARRTSTSDGGVMTTRAARARAAATRAAVARRRPGQQLAARARATARRRAGRRRRRGGRRAAPRGGAARACPATTRSPCSWASMASAPTCPGCSVAPQRDEAVVVLAPAQRARAVPGGHRGRLVEEEQLGEAARLQQRRALPAAEAQPAGDPAPAGVAAADLPGGVVQAAAVAVDQAARGVGDQLAERRDPVAPRHDARRARYPSLPTASPYIAISGPTPSPVSAARRRSSRRSAMRR